jgi:hypothetical protein
MSGVERERWRRDGSGSSGGVNCDHCTRGEKEWDDRGFARGRVLADHKQTSRDFNEA